VNKAPPPTPPEFTPLLHARCATNYFQLMPHLVFNRRQQTATLIIIITITTTTAAYQLHNHNNYNNNYNNSNSKSTATSLIYPPLFAPN